MIVDKSIVVDNNCRKALLHNLMLIYACDILKSFEQIVSAGGWCQVDKINIGIKIFFRYIKGLQRAYLTANNILVDHQIDIYCYNHGWCKPCASRVTAGFGVYCVNMVLC